MGLRKKILIVFNGNFPFGGAAANYIRYFAIGLSLQNNNVEVILPTGNYYGNNIDSNANRKGNINGVTYKHLCFVNHPRNYFGKTIDNIFGFFLSIFYIIRKAIRKELDLIIIYDTMFLNTLIFVSLKKMLRKKLVIILPEFYDKPKNKFISLTLINWYSFYYGIRYVVKYADSYIVLSQYMERYIREVLNSRKDILTIPNLIDPKMFDRENVKPYIKNKVTIGYVGTPIPQGGILDLIKSFSVLIKKFKNIHLLIVGDLTNGKSLIPELKEYANKHNISESISFTGLVSHDRIPGLLHSCQILALTRPNRIFAEAGFPTKLGEYLSCKKPVLITKVGDIPKYLRNEEHVILVEPENIKSIVDGFEKILIDKKLAEKLCQNGYKWMDENLNYLNQSKRISELMNKLVL